MPILHRHLNRLENMTVAVGGPFHAGAVDATQPDGLVAAVEQLCANHLEWQRRRRKMGERHETHP